MEQVIEQVVKSWNYEKEKRRVKIFKVLMVIFFIVFILLECFGLAVSQVYYYTDRTLFWWFMFYFALAAIPDILALVILYILTRRLAVSFDYYFDGTEFRLYKAFYGKGKKLILQFTTENILSIGRCDTEDYIKAFDPREKRKPIICAQNINNKNIYFIKARFRDSKQLLVDKVIVIEPKKELVDLLLVTSNRAVISDDIRWQN